MAVFGLSPGGPGLRCEWLGEDKPPCALTSFLLRPPVVNSITLSLFEEDDGLLVAHAGPPASGRPAPMDALATAMWRPALGPLLLIVFSGTELLDGLELVDSASE